VRERIKKLFDLRGQAWLAWAFLILVMIAYSLEMSHQAILRYETFKATAFDLGNMDQVLWNTIHGRPFQFTNQAIDWYGPPTRLAVHFEPIILPLSLLYAFHADPRILLVFQTLALAAGALPVFLLTRKLIPAWPLLGTLMATAYLMSPALLGLNIFDFHPVALATPLLLYALLALEYRRLVWFVILCILAASTKEDVPLAIALLGVLVMWKYRLPRLGLALLIGGALWSLLAFEVIIPHFYSGLQANNFWYRYEELGSSPGQAIINLFVRPWLFFGLFFTMDRVYYLFGLLRSTGFLSVLAPEWLLPTLPSLAVNLLSTDPLLYSGVYQYNATIIPFIMIAAIYGTRRLLSQWQVWRGEESLPPVPDLFDVSDVPDVPTSRARALPLATPLAQVAWHSLRKLSSLRLFAALRSKAVRLTLPAWRERQWERFSLRMTPLACLVSSFRLQWVLFAWITLMFGLNFLIAKPELDIFWANHDPGAREQHIDQLLAMIPPGASVSASDDLNPHLSDRQLITVFPSVCLDARCNQTVQYVVVDLNSLTVENQATAASELYGLRRQFRILAQADGVVLLIRRGA
jgi:uncharacterized membrane protein